MNTEADTGVMQSQAKGRLEPLEARGRQAPPIEALDGVRPCLDLLSDF